MSAPVVSVASGIRSLWSPRQPDAKPRTPARPSNHTRTLVKRDRWKCAKLWLRVQADAFAFDPKGYLQALWWRARGLRVRSRNRISSLAGRSAHAYEFWIACREPEIRAATTPQEFGPSPILVIIDCLKGADGLRQSVESLPPATRVVVVGGPPVAGATTAERAADLLSIIEGPEAWLCPISCGDRLASGALAVYSKAAAGNPTVGLIYGDDDLLDSSGRRSDPHFKPDWNAELFRHHDYLTGACVLRIGRDELRGLQDKDWAAALVRKVTERGDAPLHMPQLLHHRLRRPEPVIPAKPRKASAAEYTVTIIIPTRNRSDLLRKCIEGIQATAYPKLEIIVVDNDSDEPESVAYLRELSEAGLRVMRLEGPFNYSVLNNAAAREAAGDLLCFLNNDIEMLEPDWLSLLVRQAVRPNTGAVGARLLYPDGTVQHAGVFTGIGGGAGHGHRFVDRDSKGYFDRARLPQWVTAVTAACLVVSREKFLAVGGFDEVDFPVAFNDVDLCLKLNERGWQSFYEPRATLIHHESKSRGSDSAKANRARFADELAALKRKWRTDEGHDPFHHPHLSPFCEQFLIGV